MGTWISPLVSCVLLATAGLPATAAPAGTPPNLSDRAAPAPAAEAMKSAAEALLAALDADQRAKASCAVSSLATNIAVSFLSPRCS